MSRFDKPEEGICLLLKAQSEDHGCSLHKSEFKSGAENMAEIRKSDILEISCYSAQWIFATRTSNRLPDSYVYIRRLALLSVLLNASPVYHE